MALTACSDCGHQVSTGATACPSCGAPVAPRSMGDVLGKPTSGELVDRPVTIEQTSKSIKLLMLIGALIFLVGLFMALGNLSGDPAMAAVGLLLCILGAAIYFVAKIRRW
jgi:uncharacterized membrane protein YvbJ